MMTMMIVCPGCASRAPVDFFLFASLHRPFDGTEVDYGTTLTGLFTALALETGPKPCPSRGSRPSEISERGPNAASKWRKQDFLLRSIASVSHHTAM